VRVAIQVLIDVGNCPIAELQVYLPHRLFDQPPQGFHVDLVSRVYRFKAKKVHLLVQFVIIIYQTLVVPIYDVELKVCLDAQKHFEVECELISPTLLVGHIDVKIFDIFSEHGLCNASDYPLFVLFTIYERAERLIEVD
jgi:hypothetical protein